MPAQQQHTVWTAYLSATSDDVDVGHCLVLNSAASGYVIATSAARATAGRTGCVSGISLTAGSSTHRAVEIQSVGVCPESVTGLGTGAAGPVIVGSTGLLERKATPTSSDIVVGRCDADGLAYLNFAGAKVSVGQLEGTLSVLSGGTGGTALPGSSGDVLYNNAGAIGSVDRTQLGGWITALDIDFSAQATQSLPANTTYTIGSNAWSRFNAASDASTMALTASDGIVMTPIQASDYTGSTRTGPGLNLPLLPLIPLLSAGMPLRVTAYVSSSNQNDTYDNAIVGVDSQSAVAAYLLRRGRHGGGAMGITAGLQAESVATVNPPNRNLTLGVANNVVQVEIPRLCDPIISTRYGQYSSGWPTSYSGTATFIGAIEDMSGLTPSNAAIVLAAQRAGSATTGFSVTFARLKVEYRL